MGTGISRGAGFRRTQAMAVLGCAAAAIAAWAQLAPFVRAPLGFLLMGVIPGWLLAESLLRSSGVTSEEKAMASLVFSIPVVIVARVLAFAAGLPAPAFVWTWAATCAVWALILRPPARSGPPADRVAWLVAGALALLVALPAGLNFVIRVSGDAMFHAQIVNEIRLRGIPPQDPSFAGMPLAYMWQFHVWIATLVEAMGLSPYGVFPWVSGAMMAALAFAAYRAAALFWPEPLYRRLAPAVVALGMNALGWVVAVVPALVRPMVGENRGLSELHREISTLILHPAANEVSGALIYRSHMILSSLLFKFFGANALGAGITLVAVTLVLLATGLREGGRGRLVAAALAGSSAAIIHPLVGVPAGLALLAGLALAAMTADGRGAALRFAAALALGLALGAAVVRLMLHAGLEAGEPTRLHLVTANLPPLVQDLDVVILPALWGWIAVFRRSRPLALLGLGFAVTCLAFALVVDLPYVGEKYLIYVAYLGVALFAAAGVGALVSAAARRVGATPAWTLAALVFLPSALLQANGFARQSDAWGLAGYPETRDEIAAFDYVRDHTPLDAVVIDSQYFSSSSVAAYSGRRGFFGGMKQAALVGYPRGEMAARERAVVNLLFEPDVAGSAMRVLRSVRAPLFVVARRTPPRDRITDPRPGPLPDPIAKLDALPSSFEPAIRTPTIAIYRFVVDIQGTATPRPRSPQHDHP